MLVLSENLDASLSEIGAKTLNLKILKQMGCNVPVFVALPSSAVLILHAKSIDSPEYRDLIEEIKQNLKVSKFVVRSSALIEDGSKTSYAGQFLTKIDLSIDQVSEAIKEVIDDAHKKLNAKLELFSIIIQEYLTADTAGVCFTRDPLGNRNMVIEYHQGIGEDVVSGKIRPTKIIIYWNQDSDTSEALIPSAIPTFQQIEQYFKTPQDIEWLIKNQQLFLLQTRPITTIDENQYQQIKYLDKVLPEERFFYEKTEISEIAAKPTAFTLDLLQKIYALNGPVDQVYKKYGIRYVPEDFLKVIGDELYVDREREIKTLLPSYTYLKNGRPSLNALAGFGRSMINAWKLNRLPQNPDELYKKLSESIQRPLKSDDQIFEKFLKNYQLIFEVNLLAAKALKTLELFAKREKISQALILTLPHDLSAYKIVGNFEGWLGNSLQVDDESPFYRIEPNFDSGIAPKIFNNLSQIKQAYLKPLIYQAQVFGRLREYGRWLTVKYVNAIRSYLFSVAGTERLADKRNIYFSRIDELGRISEEELVKRKQIYASFAAFHLPAVLTNLTRESNSGLVVVSSGTAIGVLKSAEQIKPEDKNVILYTKVLSPDLTRFFSNISGIISQQGGMLSHLAIVAREKGLPVVINYGDNFPLGSQIKIDTDSETITLDS